MIISKVRPDARCDVKRYAITSKGTSLCQKCITSEHFPHCFVLRQCNHYFMHALACIRLHSHALALTLHSPCTHTHCALTCTHAHIELTCTRTYLHSLTFTHLCAPKCYLCGPTAQPENYSAGKKVIAICSFLLILTTFSETLFS